MNKKTSLLALAFAAFMTVTSCGKDKFHVEIPRDEDAFVYEQQLGSYNEKVEALADKSGDERYIAYAEAEAELLGAAVMMPWSTQGGNYAVTRVAPHTVPFVKWGNDEDRLKGIVAITGADTFITSAQREELLGLWEAAKAGGAEYNPAAKLREWGYSIATDYKTTFSTAPATLDILNTSEQSDTEILVNCFDGLVEYDNLNQQQASLATSFDVSADGLTYTFHIREGVKWVTSTGADYGKTVTAQNFVDGFRHMLDAQAGLDYLVDGVVVGVSEYLGTATDDNGDPIAKDPDFSKVGVKAQGQDLIFTLTQPESYFPTRLTYSCFMPLQGDFFASKGGVFGLDEWKAAAPTVTFGTATDPASNVYCGAYYPSNIQEEIIELKKNELYYNKDAVKMNSLTWVYDNGEDLNAFFDQVMDGTYVGCNLVDVMLTKSKDKSVNSGKNLYNDCKYVTDTTSTTYLLGMNLNRGTYELASGACKSAKTSNAAAVLTNKALQNVHFRRAIFRAWDRVSYNKTTRDEAVAAFNLRNTYTDPNFLSLAEAQDYVGADGHEYHFAKGTSYGELVQAFGDHLGLGVNFADGQDGWYDTTKAKAEIELAIKELGSMMALSEDGKIHIDNVYYSASSTQVANAAAFKASIEAAIGDYVVVDSIEATTSDDFYASGYRAKNGAAGNFDVFYGSGWGPDYGDPSTYLDTFAPQGYMCKIIGLY